MKTPKYYITIPNGKRVTLGNYVAALKKFLSLSLLLCSLHAHAKPHARTLTIHNESAFPFLVLLATPPPAQSFAFTWVDARSSVSVSLDAFEYRTIGGYSRPCSPLHGPGSIWFVGESVTVEAAIDYNDSKHRSVILSPDLDLILRK